MEQTRTRTHPRLYISTTQSPNAIALDVALGHCSVQELIDYFEQRDRDAAHDNARDDLAIGSAQEPDQDTVGDTAHRSHKRFDSAVDGSYHHEREETTTGPTTHLSHTSRDTQANYFHPPPSINPTNHQQLCAEIDAHIAHTRTSLSLTSLWAAQDATGWGPSTPQISDFLARQAQYEHKHQHDRRPMRRLSSLSKGITGGLKRTLSLGKGREETDKSQRCGGKTVERTRSDASAGSMFRTKSWRRASEGMGSLFGVGRRKTVHVAEYGGWTGSAGEEGMGTYGKGGRRRFVISDETVDAQDKKGLENEKREDAESVKIACL